MRGRFEGLHMISEFFWRFRLSFLVGFIAELVYFGNLLLLLFELFICFFIWIYTSTLSKLLTISRNKLIDNVYVVVVGL